MRSPLLSGFAGALLLWMGLTSPSQVILARAQGAVPSASASSAPSPPPPSAPPPLGASLQGPALADYEAGKLLFQDGDFAGALLKFQSAHATSHDARLLWNMATCEKNLRHYSRALTHLDAYIKQGGAAITDQDRAEAADLIKNMSAFVGTLKVVVDPPGAQVFVDDELVGTSPLAGGVRVDLGTHRVRVTKQGLGEQTRSVQSSGASDTVTIKLTRELHEGKLQLRTDPDATVVLDGKVVGTGGWDGTLTSGGHSLRLSSPGMRTQQTEVTIRDGETRTLELMLEKEPSTGSGPWPWIVGGVGVLGGAIVGGYFLFRKSDPGASPPPGTVAPGFVQLRFPRW